MRRRYPQHRLNPADIAVYDPAGGVLRPEACILAAVRRADALGACLVRDTASSGSSASQMHLTPVQKFADRYLAGVEPHASRAQVCMYTNTPDRHSLIGTLPDRPWMLVLGGFSGHGFKYASAIGEGAASWSTVGRIDPSFDFLALDRFPRTQIEQ